MFNKQNQYLAPLAFASFLIIGIIIGKHFGGHQTFFSEGEGGNHRFFKLQEIIQVLNKRYVDSINSEQIFEETISDMLHKLDPHSNYIPADKLKAMNESINGKFSGIGIRFFIIRDTVAVTNVLSFSPSMTAGLKAGDKILKVDTIPVAGQNITNEKIMKLLKGVAGTKVKLIVLRNKEKKEIEITRGDIPIESVVASFMIDDEKGYIKIDQFSMTTAEEFRYAARRLLKQGVKKLILDLRNNGGGVFSAAVEIADEFLPAGTPIVETRGAHSKKEVYTATPKGMLEDIELAVIINSNSASASEIIAGAIQDNDRGVIIGRRSFGKGLVQTDMTLKDGSNLRLTIARYYTPTGRCIQKPYTDNYEDYYKEQAHRFESGEMYQIDSTLLNDSLKYTTPSGRTVYGGGGIMPDVFVPLDSAGASWYLTELRYSGTFTMFAFDYIQDKRNQWKSITEYINNFKVTDKIFNDFIEYAKKELKIEPIQTDIQKSKKLIKQMIKEEIARQLWMEQGYYRVKILHDKDIQKTIEVLVDHN